MNIINTINRLKKANKLEYYIHRAKNIMYREKAESMSDEEIERCTEGVAASEFYKKLLQYSRDHNLIAIN